MQETYSRAQRGVRRDLGLALSTLSRRIDIVALMTAIIAAGWWWSVTQMSGHDAGPWSALGSAGWFLLMWVIMMGAMMLPSALPTITLYAFMTRKRSPLYSLLFMTGYMLTWAVAGLVVYGVSEALGRVTGGSLSWNGIGRGVAALTLIGAAVYQLTPLKAACLEKCRSPFAQLQATWREGFAGSVWMGVINGAWCLGCCWAMMAGLFALGIMNLTWMTVLAVIMAAEKLLPWEKPVMYATAGLLVILGILIFFAPNAIPGITIPLSGNEAAPAHHLGH